jgi:hypothetical protein
MSLRCWPTKPGCGKKAPQPPSITNNVPQTTVVATVVSAPTVDIGPYVAQIAQLEAQIAILEAEAIVDAATIASLQSQVLSLQSQVASLQAGAVIDAATIVSLNAQIVSLQSQVASLSNRFPVLFYTNLTTIDDNFYVPPSFDDITVSVTNAWTLSTVLAYNNITTLGGGYP